MRVNEGRVRRAWFLPAVLALLLSVAPGCEQYVENGKLMEGEEKEGESVSTAGRTLPPEPLGEPQWYGASVALGADFLAIGVPLRDSVWIRARTFDASCDGCDSSFGPPGGATDVQFGRSLAASDHTVVVGARGAAFVFVRSGETWSEQARFEPGLGASFGQSVAISGDRVLVGAQGTVVFYDRNGLVTWTEEQRIQAPGDFGQAVDIDGDTAVVGAQGEAFVYSYSGGVWSEQARLAGRGKSFGSSVAVDGDEIVVGDPDTGEARVFERDGAAWRERATLAHGAGEFGRSVDIANGVLLVGAPRESVIEGREEHGAAFVFTRTADSWEEQRRLIREPEPGGGAGSSVALDGGTFVVGAPFTGDGEGKVLVFEGEFTPVPLSRVRTLRGSDDTGAPGFGLSVDIDGDTVAAGHPGDDAAYVFTRFGNGWEEQQKLTALDSRSSLGTSIGLSGDTVVTGDPVGNAAGTAYVFTRSGTTWTQAAKLSASDGKVADNFGGAIAIDGDRIAVGAVRADLFRGAVYTFTRTGAHWTEEQKIPAPAKSPDLSGFGGAVALEGDTLVIGQPDEPETPGGEIAGAVHVYVLDSGFWVEQATLVPDTVYSTFGASVSLDGDTLAIGAPGDRSVYVFTRSGSAWTLEQKIRADLLLNFGTSVAVRGDTLLSSDPQTGVGLCVVYTRTAGEWTEQRRLLVPDDQSASLFGQAVAVGPGELLVGAPYGTPGGAVFAYGSGPAPKAVRVARKAASPKAGGNRYLAFRAGKGPDPATLAAQEYLDLFGPFRWEVSAGAFDRSRWEGLEGGVFAVELGSPGLDPDEYYGLRARFESGGLLVSAVTHLGEVGTPISLLGQQVDFSFEHDGTDLILRARTRGFGDFREVARVPLSDPSTPLRRCIRVEGIRDGAVVGFDGSDLTSEGVSPVPRTREQQAVDLIYQAIILQTRAWNALESTVPEPVDDPASLLLASEGVLQEAAALAADLPPAKKAKKGGIAAAKQLTRALRKVQGAEKKLMKGRPSKAVLRQIARALKKEEKAIMALQP